VRPNAAHLGAVEQGAGEEAPDSHEKAAGGGRRDTRMARHDVHRLGAHAAHERYDVGKPLFVAHAQVPRALLCCPVMSQNHGYLG
jgi:hypothetical protein